MVDKSVDMMVEMWADKKVEKMVEMKAGMMV